MIGEVQTKILKVWWRQQGNRVHNKCNNDFVGNKCNQATLQIQIVFQGHRDRHGLPHYVFVALTKTYAPERSLEKLPLFLNHIQTKYTELINDR